jgi:hypothetical protein
VGARLLVVDTFSQFAGLHGDAENSAGDGLAAMQPLQAAAAQGLGVLTNRHERKSGGEVGDSGRGSSAIAGAVDIVLALRRPEGTPRPTIRMIHGLSRLDGTPDELMIELVGGQYVSLGTAHDVAAQEARKAILESCPEDEAQALPEKVLLKINAGLKRTTLQEALSALVTGGQVARVGKGKKTDPYRYHLANSFCRNSITKSGTNNFGIGQFAEMVSAETPGGSGRMNPVLTAGPSA